MSNLQPHPYADAWPMMPDDELAELAEDIKVNGQREPVVLYSARILDGRNRYAACALAGVKCKTETFAGTDDEALAYVQSVNNERRHQSKGSRAASWALSMLAAGKRGEGRWAYGETKSPDSEISYGRRAELGIIADFTPDALYDIRADDISLNAAYEAACAERDAERNRLEAEDRAAQEEAEAKAFVESNAPDLAAQVGDVFQSYAEAHAVWEKRNREEAARIKAEKEAEAKAKRQRVEALSQTYTRIATFLQIAATYGANDDPAAIMADYSPKLLDPRQLERWFAPKELDNARRFIDALSEWSK